MMIEEIPRLRNVSFRVCSQFRYIAERIKKMALAALNVSTTQGRISALAEKPRADFLDRDKVVLAHAAKACDETFELVLIELGRLVNDHPLRRLLTPEFLVPFNDQLHQSLRAIARKMGAFALVPAKRQTANHKGLAVPGENLRQAGPHAE